MIRPELKAALWRAREVIASLALAAVGIWWGLASFGIVQLLGWALAVLGVGMAFGAAQRMRFKPDDDGPGVVTIDERRVTYLGPRDGGVADLDLMVRLELTPQPFAAWQLVNDGGHVVRIPINALGAERLFDVFSALPGMKTRTMLDVMDKPRTEIVTIWQSGNGPTFTQLQPTIH